MATLEQFKKQLQQYILQDDFESFFGHFNEHPPLNASIENLIINLQGQFNRLKRQELQGATSQQDIDRSYNGIRVSVLGVIETLDEGDVDVSSMPKEKEVVPPEKPINNLSDLERSGLERQQEILQKKLNFFRERQASTADANQAFSLEMEIEKIVQEIEAIKLKLN